jgi:anti-sigma B factor antagonist
VPTSGFLRKLQSFGKIAEEGIRMITETNKTSGVTVVKLLESRLGAGEAAQFKSAISVLIAEGYTELVLDLSNLQFMDSSGLGAMVSVFKMLGHRGNVTVAGISKNLFSLFRMTGMDRVFPVYRSADEAVESILCEC